MIAAVGFSRATRALEKTTIKITGGYPACANVSPMNKDFPSFDCDAQIAEPMAIWEHADHLTHDELAALKTTTW